MSHGRRWAARALLLLFASIFIVALLVRSVGVDRLLSTLRSADHGLLWLAAACYAAELGLRMARWRLLFRATTLGPAMSIWWIGTGVNELLPSGAGELSRGVVGSQRYGISVASVLAPTAVERLADLIVLLGLAGFAVLVLVAPFSPLAVLVPLLAVLAGLMLLLRPELLAWPSGRLERHAGWRSRAGAFLRRLSVDLAEVRHRRLALGATLALTVAIWTLEGAVQWFALRAVGGFVPYSAALGFTALAFLFGFVSFLPGGLGSREAALAGLLQSAGVAAHIGTTSSVAVRAAQTLFVLLVGAGAAALGLRGRAARRDAAQHQARATQPLALTAQVAPVLGQDGPTDLGGPVLTSQERDRDPDHSGAPK
jgi:uncharacterized protein (TIRG00374 family)